MQVYAVLSHHVMFIARISEEIRLGARVDAGTQERQGVLRDAHRVVVTDDDLEFAFQVTGFESQVTAFVAFWDCLADGPYNARRTSLRSIANRRQDLRPHRP